MFDVVFSFDISRYASSVERFIEKMSVRTVPDGRKAAETHVREEYSTCGWIMEGLLERAGFRIDDADYRDDFLAAYLCTRKSVPVSIESPAAVGGSTADPRIPEAPSLPWNTLGSRL